MQRHEKEEYLTLTGLVYVDHTPRTLRSLRRGFYTPTTYISKASQYFVF